MKKSTRKDVQKLASEIEELAKELQETLKDQKGFLGAVSALANRSMTMVFVVGEVYAEEQLKVARKASYANRAYVRDASGRFCSK